VAGLALVLAHSAILTALLTVFGAAFLLCYGVRALLRAVRAHSAGAPADPGPLSLRATMAQAAGFTLLNPHVYLDTVLLMGSIGARQPGDARWWFVGGAAAASSLWFAALGFGARLLAPLFAHPRAWRVLDTLIGLTMLAIAALLLRQALAAGLVEWPRHGPG
jgi:L-lysine exporter family protein LysE/ArgO